MIHIPSQAMPILLNVRANFTAIKNVLSQAALDGGWIRAQVVTSDPTAGNKGRIIFNETEEQFKVDDGASWVQIGCNIKYGSYVGNGNDNRSITGVGFAPDIVFVYLEKDAADCRLMIKINDASTDKCWLSSSSGVNSQVVANRIQALETDGFQVGNSIQINENGVTYRYMAIKEG